VSIEGGERPEWRGDGRELYFIANGGMYAVDVEPGQSPTLGQPRLLFQVSSSQLLLISYAPSADGQRFLMVRDHPTDANEERAVEVVQNWWREGRK
jgi:hypothetical protein